MTLKKRREELHLSQQDLAYRLGVSVSTLSNWERGIHTPRRVYLPLIAETLSVTVAQVTAWTGEE